MYSSIDVLKTLQRTCPSRGCVDMVAADVVLSALVICESSRRSAIQAAYC